MALISSTHGRAGVRVMRIKKDGPQQEVREVMGKLMLPGEFDAEYTRHDNSTVVTSDTVKNRINIVARENLGLDSEEFCQAVAARFLQRYHRVETVTVQGLQTKWMR